MNVINTFDGDYRWLSNFYQSPLQWGDIVYPTVEHAYQASKTNNSSVRFSISRLSSPGEALRAGHDLVLSDDWTDEHKIKVMELLLRKKFYEDPLRRLLVDTHPVWLINTNMWGDVFWGMYRGKGENHLGVLLMKIRGDVEL